MKAEDLINVSIRGRVAFLIICLEEALKHFRINEKEWSFILELLWSYTHANVGKWHEDLAECVPQGVLKDTEDLSDLEFLNEEQFWRLNNLFQKTDTTILRIVDIIYYVGIKDLYASIANNSPETLRYLQEAIDLMNQNGIPLPEIHLFEKFPITENAGWGREFVREELFNGGK